MKSRNWHNRCMAILLAVAMVLGIGLPVAAAQTESYAIPDGISRIVYVNGSATGNADGTTPENAYLSLDEAFKALGDGDAVIILCGRVTISESYNTSGTHTHTGVYYITGKYGTIDHSDVAEIEYKYENSSDMIINHGGQVHYSNLKLTANCAKSVVFYTSTGMIIGDGVKTVLTSGKFKIFGGSYDKDVVSSYIKVSSGQFETIMGTNDKNEVTDQVDIVIGGDAKITSNLTLGYKKEVKKVNFTMNGGSIETLYAGTRKGGSITESIVMNLNGGTIQTITDHTATTLGDITVNLKADFTDVSGNYGAWTMKDFTTGARTLNLIGYDGTFGSNVFGKYDIVNMTEGSNITLEAQLGNDTLVNVAAGCALRLAGNEDGSGLNIQAEDGASVKYGMQAAAVVFVRDSGDDNNDGMCADTAVKTLSHAYSMMDKTEGGTIVICGKLSVSTYDAVGAGITGRVTLTSVYEGIDYIADEADPAMLYLSGGSAELGLSGDTLMDDLKIGVETKAFIHSGRSLEVGKNVTRNDTKDLKLFCGTMSDTQEDIQVSVAGGTWHSIFMGGNKKKTGNVKLTISDNVVVTSNIPVGGNSGAVGGDMELFMNGGSVKVIYSTPYSSTKVGNVSIHLNGGIITSDLKAKGSASLIGGDIHIELGDTDISKISSLGTWTGNDLPEHIELNITCRASDISASLAGYTQIKVGAGSVITYGGKLKENCTVNVAEGGILTLSGYEDQEAATAAGVIINGKVLFGSEEIEYLDVVYVNGDVTGGDGKTPVTAVNNLKDAYALLDRQKGGTVVICGPVSINGEPELETFGITGTVTITSKYGTEDYTETASLIWAETASALALDNHTVLHDLHFVLNAAKATDSLFIYSGSHMQIQDGITCSGTGYLKVFVSKFNSVETDNCVAEIASGSYRQIFLGANKKTTGDATLTISGTAKVTSNVAMGGNSTSKCNNITFNMNGGYVKVIYDVANNNSKVLGSLTMNLNAGSIVEMRDYNGNINQGIGGNITINVNCGSFNPGTAQFGVWQASGLTVGGTKTLNLYNYQGASFNSLTNYDQVNVFDAVSDSYIPAAVKGSLNIHDYSGDFGLSLSGFTSINASGTADVTFIGTVPTDIKLTADDTATLRIRPSVNSGVTRGDYVIEEKDMGKIVIEDPAYKGLQSILEVSFDDEAATDHSGNGNNGTITGQPSFVDGYDGGKAIYINNAFGKDKATQYVTFQNLKGLDITRDDYTIRFWYHTVNGGHTTWATSSNATTAGSDVNMNKVKVGGVVFSNQDTVTDSSGISAVQLSQNQFFTMGLTDHDGTHYDADSIRDASNDSWHMITVTVDRSNCYKVYVDENLVTSKIISQLKDQTIGIDKLVLGADALGQYGLENAYIDDLTVYAGAMSHSDVMANYYADRLGSLIHAAEQSLDTLGHAYDAYRAEFAATVAAAKKADATYSVENYQAALSVYQQLNASYEAFLSAPQKDAKLSALLISDIHITAEGDVDSKRLETMLADLVANDLVPDMMINGGDFADNSFASTTQAAYNVFNSLIEKYGLDEMMMIAAYGNHETAWDAENSNYKASTPVYWENIMKHLSTFVQEGKATIDSMNYDGEIEGGSNSFSYAVTYQGYHFVILNGDYLEQTGCSKNVLDENGNYAIEGNELDPIRHGAYFEEETLQWLDHWMKTYSEDGLPIFVVNHFPFIDSCPLSSFSEIVINDNSIGRQDAEVRKILAAYDDVFYFCGHLHSSFGMIGPVEVVSEGVGSFIQLNLPAIKGATRAYANVPSTWIMYVYEDEIVLRARDFTTGQWLPQYDQVLKLSAAADPDDTDKPDDSVTPDDTQKPDDTNKPDDSVTPDDSPKTADTSALAAAAAAMTLGAAAAYATTKKKRSF